MRAVDPVAENSHFRLMQPLVSLPFETYATSVAQALEAAGAADILTRQERILLKPNLVTASPFPVTTHPAFTEAVLTYVRACSKADVIIAEGCGDAKRETPEIFRCLGYEELAKRHGVPLVDLNSEPCLAVSRPGMNVLEELHLPRLALDSFIVSLPVLKAHSIAGMTGTIKNMMGLLPPQVYQGNCGSWKKNSFHARMQASLGDLALCLLPGLTVMDASVGLAQYHLGGPPLEPPAMRILAGFDSFAVDREAARLLGLDPQSIGHLWPQPKERFRHNH